MPLPKRCLRCFYILDGLPETRCPECGLGFDPADPRTYSIKPPFIWWKYWLPGFLLAVTLGLVACLWLLYTSGYGWSTALLIPFCLGCTIGYGCKVRSFLIFLLLVGALFTVGLGLYTAHAVGLFCGLVFSGVAVGPAVLGGIFGMSLRSSLKRSRFSQKQWLPLFFLWLIPVAGAFVEGRHHYPNETIETSMIIPASVANAWDGVMFFEEVQHQPPLLLRLLLPRPLYTSGGTQYVGDIKYCVYSKGRLVKKITRRQEGRLLAFDVIEQVNIETKSVRLTAGEFRFQSLGPTETRVTLATEYQPLLGPRFAWRWAESWATHTLHRHVLEGMKRKAIEASRDHYKDAITRRLNQDPSPMSVR